MRKVNVKNATLAGTATLSALTVVFDYTLKFSGLKIPFPWLPFLKFDFTGVPIVLSLLIYGLSPGVTTSIIGSFAILLRSGDYIGSSMKGLSEFSTIFGMAIGLRLHEKFRKATSFLYGIAFRCIIMCFANIIILPAFHVMQLEAATSLIPLLVVFNIMHGTISILLGYFIYEVIKRRILL